MFIFFFYFRMEVQNINQTQIIPIPVASPPTTTPRVSYTPAVSWQAPPVVFIVPTSVTEATNRRKLCSCSCKSFCIFFAFCMLISWALVKLQVSEVLRYLFNLNLKIFFGLLILSLLLL